MRIPSIPTLLRTVLTYGNATLYRVSHQPFFNARPQLANHTIPLRASMPTIPFLGALFSSGQTKMSDANYPVQKSDSEWRAVLSPGTHTIPILKTHFPPFDCMTDSSRLQSSSASSAKKAPSIRARGSTTSTHLPPGSTTASPAKLRSTHQRENSRAIAGGQLSSKPSLERSRSTAIPLSA